MRVDKLTRSKRREQQAKEIEASQLALRQSIAETDRLVGESDEMLKRHHEECERDDADEAKDAYIKRKAGRASG